MGLDAVEIILCVEERFGVDIPDFAGASIVTLGDLHQYVRTSLNPSTTGKCAGQMVFHRLRRALVSSRLPRQGFRPDVELAAVMTLEEWRTNWRRLSGLLGLRMPDRELPRWYVAAGTGSAVSAAAAGAWAFGAGFAVAAAFATAAAAGLGARRVSAPREQTIGDLVISLVDQNYGALLCQGAAWRDEEAMRSIRALISAQLGIPMERLSADTPLADNMTRA